MEAIFSLGAVSAGQSGPTPGGGGPAGVTPANEVSLWRNKRRRKRKQVTQRPTYLFFFLNLEVQSRSLSLSFSYLLLIITESQNDWDIQESPTKII